MEWNDALGLNIYEMDLRQYDPAVGRWVVQDPVIHHEFSPYSAFDNNPVYWADPSGADAVPVTVMDLFNATGNGSNATFEFSNGRMISANTSAELEAFLSEVLQGALEMQPLGDVEHEISKGNGHGDGGGNGGGNGNGNGDGNELLEFRIIEIGTKVLEAKTSFLGKIWGTLEPREWTDRETGIVYQVDTEGNITGIRPIGG